MKDVVVTVAQVKIKETVTTATHQISTFKKPEKLKRFQLKSK